MTGIPQSLEVREAIPSEDSFFDSVAQALMQLMPELNPTVKSLRQVCKRFAQSQLEMEKSWLKEVLTRSEKKDRIQEYISRIEFTANDIEQQRKSEAANDLVLAPSAVWGRSDIEGRIICNKFNLKLHVVEKFFVEGKEMWTHQIVDGEGSKSVGDENRVNEGNVIHIANKGDLHFQPILRITDIQHNEQSADCLTTTITDRKDSKIERLAKELIAIIKDSTIKEKLSKIKKLLENKPMIDINFHSELHHNHTPLHWAVMEGDVPIVSFLSDKLKNIIDAQTKEGNTALHLAAANGDLTVVKILITQRKANTDIKNDQGKSALELAEERGYLEIKKWIDRYSKINAKPHDQADADSYEKNSQAAQTRGHSYEVKLLMFFLLMGKEKIKNGKVNSIYLASDMNEARGFDDIVFKCEGNGGSKLIFLQAKHRDKENTVNKYTLFSERNDFDLKKYFKAFKEIKAFFSHKEAGNRIFGEEFSNVDCSFIIFTNAMPQFEEKYPIYKELDCEDINFGKTNYYYRLSPNEEIYKAFLLDGNNDTAEKEELDEFLSRLKLFLGQPDEKELGEKIKQLIQSRYSVKPSDIDQVFASIENKIQEWHRKKGRSEFLTGENRFFEDAERLSITFDVKEPVALFTGRIEQLNNLHSILQNAGEAVISQIASVTGLGGVGKSELARKYISECSKEYDDNVIWINAENYLTIADSFGRVAEEKLGISTLDEQGKKREIRFIVEDVYQYFTKMHRKSLFVFDNAEKHKSYGEKDEGIDRFLPSGRNKPHVLITSRDQEWREIKALALDVFTPEEAVEFIKKALKDVVNLEEEEESNVIKKLAAELQYLPLALTQAVAYIQMENQALKKWEEIRFTVSRYLELYKVNVRELLSRGSSKILDRYTRTVMTTWEITIEKIKEKGPQGGGRALEMLNVIAYLAPDKVPVDVIFSKLVNDVDERRNAVKLLDHYSLVSLAGVMLNMHRLVQQVTRIELEEQGKNRMIIDETFKLLRDSFTYNSDSYINYISVSEKTKLLPHLKALLSHLDSLIIKKPDDLQNVKLKYYLKDLLMWIADGYSNLGDPRKSKEQLERVLPILKNHYGSKSHKVAKTLIDLSKDYECLGDYKKMKKLLKEALMIREDHYGPNHFEVAATLANLANAYGLLGNPNKKKELLEQALIIMENLYGSNHMLILKTLVNLGNVCGDLGNLNKQKELLERAKPFSSR